MTKNRAKNKGLTLTEVTVSTLIFAVTVVAIYAVHVNAKRLIVLASHKITALYWAQEEIERLRNQVRPNDETTGPPRYPFNYAGAAVKGRDLVASGALISYPVNFAGTAYTPPVGVPYYGAGAGGAYNILSGQFGGKIYQSVDCNSANPDARGYRQVTVRVRWDE